MNKITKILSFCLAVYGYGILGAHAATYNAANCGNSAIQSAINSAADGDTVLVPSGTCTWSGTVSIPASKGIALVGAGIDATVINGGNLILSTAVDKRPSRITGFTFNFSVEGSEASFLTINPEMKAQSNNWRIDNCKFVYQRTGWYEAAIWIKGWTFGLIDHCIFKGTPRGIMVEATNINIDNSGSYGDFSWSQEIDLGTPKTGNLPRAVYVENCIFDEPKSAGDQAIESRFGARYVFRYNKVNGYQVNTHSGCTNGNRGPVQAEVYNNTFDYKNYYNAIWLRTVGTALIHSNIIKGGYSVGIEISQEESCKGCIGIYSNAPFTFYPMKDNLGRIPPNQTLAPLYGWSNTLDGNPTKIGYRSGYYCSAIDSMVQENRDYYNIAAGIELPVSCNPKQAYFKTNEGPQGILYQCSAPNNWTKYYSPYLYPHPLSSGSYSFSYNQDNLNNQDNISAPSSLKILN